MATPVVNYINWLTEKVGAKQNLFEKPEMSCSSPIDLMSRRQETQKTTWPWIVEIGEKCAGTILSSRFVLTSDDCCNSLNVTKTTNGGSIMPIGSYKNAGLCLLGKGIETDSGFYQVFYSVELSSLSRRFIIDRRVALQSTTLI